MEWKIIKYGCQIQSDNWSSKWVGRGDEEKGAIRLGGNDNRW